MRILTIFFFALSSSLSMAASLHIPMTQEQRDNLGIQTTSIDPTKSVLGRKLPAEVVVPNKQLYIISTQQSGLVEYLAVAEGDQITTGQQLASIQSPDLLTLQRDFLQSLTKYKLAKKNYLRAQAGVKDDVIPRQELLKAESAFEEISASLSQQRATLKISGMSTEEIGLLESNKILTSNISIKSPIDGFVLEQLVSSGERVNAATPLYRVGKLKPLWLIIHVPLEIAESINIGDSVVLAECNIEGEIITIGKQVHTADQGVAIRAIINEGAEQLRPGQFVQVQFPSKIIGKTNFIVEQNTLVRAGNKSYIFVEVTDGFQAYEVSVISGSESGFIIAGNLPENPSVAVSGTAALKSILLGIGGED